MADNLSLGLSIGAASVSAYVLWTTMKSGGADGVSQPRRSSRADKKSRQAPGGADKLILMRGEPCLDARRGGGTPRRASRGTRESRSTLTEHRAMWVPKYVE